MEKSNKVSNAFLENPDLNPSITSPKTSQKQTKVSTINFSANNIRF